MENLEHYERNLLELLLNGYISGFDLKNRIILMPRGRYFRVSVPEGWNTKYIEDEFYAYVSPYKRKVRPLVGGLSIGTHNMVGTLGIPF